MNISNLSALMQEIELSQLKLGPQILKQINELCGELEPFSLDNNGYDIQDILLTLPSDVLKALEVTSVVNSLHMNNVVHDITEIRQSVVFKGAQADKNPHRVIGFFAFILFIGCLYEVFLFAVDYTNTHGKFDGFIYHMLKGIINAIIALFSLL